MPDAHNLDLKCPNCHKSGSIHISKNTILCSADGCDFSVEYACPICDQALTTDMFDDSTDSETFTCAECSRNFPVKKVAYIIENGLVIDQGVRCGLCNAPTMHRPEMNMGHRCLFFPKCSGQGDLFNQKHESLVFLDFETTGLEFGRDAIIEIGALKIDEDGYEHSFQRFVKPPHPIDPRITKITGITDEMVDDAPPIKEVMAEFLTFLDDGIVVAHNAEFDVPWLIVTCMVNELELNNNTVICTLKWAKKNKEPRASLGVLTKKYKIQHDNAHRALADAVSTKELFLIFESQFRENRLEESISTYRPFCEKVVERYASK